MMRVPGSILVLRRSPDDVPMVTADGVEIAVLREEQDKAVEGAAVRALGQAIWDNRGMHAVHAAAGKLDPRHFVTSEEFVSAMSRFVFLELAHGPIGEDVTMLGKRSTDAEQLNTEIADLADSHEAVQAFERGEEVFQAAWGLAQADQRTAFVQDAQRRASELQPDVLVRPWADEDMIHAMDRDSVAKGLRDEVERYAMESARIIGTTHLNGTVSTDAVLASWENSGLTWSSANARATV